MNSDQNNRVFKQKHCTLGIKKKEQTKHEKATSSCKSNVQFRGVTSNITSNVTTTFVISGGSTD
jgi:hypothetical protein